MFNIFGGGSKDDDEEKEVKEKDSPNQKEIDQMMMAKHKETWDNLDAAKKKRRLQEFLKVPFHSCTLSSLSSSLLT